MSVFLPLRELKPETRMGYSKFAVPSKKAKFSSRKGMIVIYSPALIASAIAVIYAYLKSMNTYIILSASLSSLHYIKRVYEALMVHRYSGSSFVRDVLIISTSYFSFAVFVFYLSSLVPLVYERMEAKSTRQIPNGGLFQYIWCPHYLGEVISLAGVALVSQTFIIVAFQFSSTIYLLVRSYNTRKWYENRFPGAPYRASVIPFIF
ncbi:hypothetical protein PHYBLDRAFT_149151 [Phycomyces blakesleeanus NRRL 1555(-)]|uniref:3-oxo-5-alpha-steroid 4-dehydrogenase C-terminal domain-containing protein n=2 Tax=Phycomyces blakesleeanus TaxID=4837 RepID=A0A167LAF5_PHYB8|nr:hypothetical protein PHYBLDRAFT_149151 [Phycomyces blakesleeanus NRRL 1555(-)]OAD69985.1 hypothetical protein PHYBLDRAFT_149151 [Phycomyces blakesleeanus NRRL 1555(-)]|eukprot:XP_018288025.1 hypothetical protein PHYBLDRAFT_149151 [Phycomyces blakesleeanus NRRL 1555(-)]